MSNNRAVALRLLSSSFLVHLGHWGFHLVSHLGPAEYFVCHYEIVYLH